MPTVTLRQMVDLSLGTPEVGAVNFNVMHALLHAMISKLQIADVKADINEADRDFLSSSKMRARSTLSEADSGKGEDSEDGMSEKSSIPPFRPTPYHKVEIKLEQLAQQVNQLMELPTNSHIFQKAADQFQKARSQGSGETPVNDIWQFLKIDGRVRTNEEGIDRAELNKNFSELPTPEQFAEFVTWPALEDALKGLRTDIGNLKDRGDRIVIEQSIQTETALPSRPSSSRVSSSRMSTSSGPSDQLLDILERLGKLSEDHDVLVKRVDDIEEQLKNKINKSDIEGLGVPNELLNQIAQLKQELDRLSQMREKQTSDAFYDSSSPPSHHPQTPAHVISQIAIRKSLPATPVELISTGFPAVKSVPPIPVTPVSSGVPAIKSVPPIPVTTVPSGFEAIKSVPPIPVTTIPSGLEAIKSVPPIPVTTIPSGIEAIKSVPPIPVTTAPSGIEAIKYVPPVAVKTLPSSSEVVESVPPVPAKTLPSSSEVVKSVPPVPVKTLPSSPEVLKSAPSIPIKTLSSSFEDINRLLSTPHKTFASGFETFESASSISVESFPTDFGSFEKRLKVVEEGLKALKNNFVSTNNFQFQPDGDSLPNWLSKMELDVQEYLTTLTNSLSSIPGKVNSEKSKENLKKEESKLENVNLVTMMEEGMKAIDAQSSSDPSVCNPTNQKIRDLASILNEQLHIVREKVFVIDHQLRQMAKGVEFALFRARAIGTSDMDSEALSRAQQAILKLQAELEKLHSTTSDLMDANRERIKELENLLAFCKRLQEEKADKEVTQRELDMKADKRLMDNKVNHSLFDSKTSEIDKLIQEILEKLAGYETDWKQNFSKLMSDIDGKLDRLELDPLKEWLEAQLKALNEKIKRFQSTAEWGEDDAAGIRKQLVQRFHCISCDRPVDMVPTGPIPSLPNQSALPPTRSPRPYTTFELDQIRQQAKSYASGRSSVNYERALAEKQLARLKKSDLKAFLVHFKQEIEAAMGRCTQQGCYDGRDFGSPEITDYYATPRPCGGSHTMTYPHKRMTRLTHLSHLFKEEETVIPTVPKEEVEIFGVDGHIYKGRRGNSKIEARLPVGVNNNNVQTPRPTAEAVTVSIKTQKSSSQLKVSSQTSQRNRPTSARATPRPDSVKGRTSSRPQSARPSHSSRTTPAPTEPQMDPEVHGETELEIDDDAIEVPLVDLQVQ
ncbi:hypothetical protein ACJMK2_034749 [Sinanodonta woodiana]|uniref:DUF4795 domain-containing protein n=1 Tax=Sinanodonta woodiana TaxID=1069815 RepID=A0ABD3WSP3_SINWO